ncbi:hypothetical protein TUBRATIS_001820 [Tubulinosema ratisbonensis]|uniref:Uncharacterized protein n=1 Tax=Tubulinosema ratisbonensis TaxID=291195 RepID=A0A437AQP1_9MICR|nr:hypothetical protein TUBRATIS_001820 [Tubulinosema ratisbonensis]
MIYKFTEENSSFIKEATTSGDIQPHLESLKSKIELKENDLLTSVSKNYLKVIQHCQQLHKISLPQEITKNLLKFKEVGNKIIYSAQSEKENQFCLERVQNLIKEINLLLKILKYFNNSTTLKEEVLFLENVKEFILKFYKFNFFTVLENELKHKILFLNKRTKEEIGDWIVFLKRSAELIVKSITFEKSNSFIFKKVYEVRKLFDMERISDLIFVCNKLNININFVYECLQNYENENELVVFALALFFLSEISEIDKYINFSKIDNLNDIKKLKQVYDWIEEDTSLLESKHKEISFKILQENKPLLEENINLFLKKVKIDYNYELAEFIDTFICNKFMEGKKVDVSLLMKDDRFIGYEWNWQIMLKKEKEKSVNEKVIELQDQLSKIFLENMPYSQKVIKLLEIYNDDVVNKIDLFLYEKYLEKVNQFVKVNELKGEVVVLAKYLEERKCCNENLKKLLIK